MTRAVLLGLVLSTAARAESPNPYLAQAKVFHQGLDYEKCLKRLDQAGKWDNSKGQLAQIELYSGLCHLALGHETEGRENFELALALDPGLTLPPMQGPKVAGLFEKARAKVASVAPVEKPDPPPEKIVEVPPPKVEPPPLPPVQDAPKRVELVPAETPPALVQTSPPKQTHLAVPVAIGAVAVAAVVVAIVFGVQARSLESRANNAAFESDAVSLGRQATTDALVANVGFSLAGAAAVAAVISFVVLN